MLVPTIRAASNVKSCFGQEQQQHFITTFNKKNVKIQVSPKNRIANRYIESASSPKFTNLRQYEKEK